MRITTGLRTLSIAVLCGTGFGLAAQQEPASTPSPAPAAAAAPSAILQPSLSMLRETLADLHPEKWKLPNPLRDETQANLSSIRRDIDATLPPLLATADAAPTAVSQVLPAYRNVEALYDVVLRVDAAARVGAPAQQSASIDQALAKLDENRRALADQLLSSAKGQEKQVSDLQEAVKVAKATPPPAPVCAPPPPPPPAKKKKPAAKPAAKPATPAATTP